MVLLLYRMYEQLTLDLWAEPSKYVTVYVNGRKYEYLHNTILPYVSVCNLAGQPYHSTIVYSYSRNSGHSLTPGMCLVLREGMIIDCVPTTNA